MGHVQKDSFELMTDAKELMKRVGYVQASLRCLANAFTHQQRILFSGVDEDETALFRLGSVVDEVMNQMSLIEGLVRCGHGLAGTIDCTQLRQFGVIALIDCLKLAIDEDGVSSPVPDDDNKIGLRWLPKSFFSRYDAMRVCGLAIERMSEFEDMCVHIGIQEIADGRRSVEPVAA